MSNTKYKFIETTGCTAFDFTANGKSLSELTNEESNELIDYLFLKIKEGLSDQTILLENVIHLFQYDDYEHDNYVCEQCGDSVTTTTWNI